MSAQDSNHTPAGALDSRYQSRETSLIPDEAATAAVPARIALDYHVLPIRLAGNTMTLAVAADHDVDTIDEIASLLSLRIDLRIVPRVDLEEAIRQTYGVGAKAIANQVGADREVGNRDGVADLDSEAEDAAVIRFVNAMLQDALKRRATDIHIEPYREHLRLRYRIDGVLYETAVPPEIHSHRTAIVSRVKILSSLDIAEHRLPQDGRIKVRVRGGDLDVRISTLPTPFGESLNIRLLAPQANLRRLDQLGLHSRQLARLERVLARPHGVVLVTGPTGSGKTTTLYACLNGLNTPERKIITIEDPIEYQLDGITQIQVHPQIGLTFARGLRSMLRHDPDVMMVGEIRDHETAEVAVQVAMTGHLVFSTVHTNDAASTATRLMDMGIEPYLIASSVECFIAQRLIRLVCKRCVGRRAVSDEERRTLGAFLAGPFDGSGVASADLGSDETLRYDPAAGASTVPEQLPSAVGCDGCNGTGYFGRTAIYEILPADDELRELILARATSGEIAATGRRAGMLSLAQDGLEKVARGMTTLEEVLRVTQMDTQLPAGPRPAPGNSGCSQPARAAAAPRRVIH